MQTHGNFEFLSEHSPILLQLARTAESIFVSDPNTTLIKLRQLGEALAQDLASRYGIRFDEQTTQKDLLNKLQQELQLDRKVRDLFHLLRIEGNKATHEFQTRHQEALNGLKTARELAVWFHRSFGKQGSQFKIGAFIPPRDPSQPLRELTEQIAQLQSQLTSANQQVGSNQALFALLHQQKAEADALAQLMDEEAQHFKQQAEAAELELLVQQEQFQAEIKQLQLALANQQDAVQQNKRRKELLNKIHLANKQIHLSEDITRELIDRQLRDVGWEADSKNLRFNLGARPEAKTFKAIAEWPTYDA